MISKADLGLHLVAGAPMMEFLCGVLDAEAARLQGMMMGQSEERGWMTIKAQYEQTISIKRRLADLSKEHWKARNPI